ncbi:unannotated protein [freshwater metagenome]|uniref:Unannotated protein n=1 Tax=freshwater metagenome TaxID=449393 RepID=A0A6J6F068_9ZZZZ
MEGEAIVETAASEGDEVVHRIRGDSRVEIHNDVALGRCNRDSIDG